MALNCNAAALIMSAASEATGSDLKASDAGLKALRRSGTSVPFAAHVVSRVSTDFVIRSSNWRS